MKNLILFPAGGVAAAMIVALATGCVTSKGPEFDPHAETSPADTNLFTDVELASRIDPSWQVPPTNHFRLGPGDVLEIEIIGEPNTRASTMVGPDGKIYYYLLKGQDVWGMTIVETKELLERELGKLIRDEPEVMLTLREVESQRVWLLGRLNTPGIYTMTQPMTVLEAITLAGGPERAGDSDTASSGVGMTQTVQQIADLKHSFLLREGRMLPVDFQRLIHEGDLSQNIYLQSDDFIYLPTVTTQRIHVLGAVANPQAVHFSDTITAAAAIASAGGPVDDAYLSRLTIIRGSLTDPKVAFVDFRDIMKGKAPNVVLEPHDIVYVPFSPFRKVTQYVELALDTFARTVGANEGGRAVSKGSQPVGISLPAGGLISTP